MADLLSALLNCSSQNVDWTAIGTMIIAVGTIALVIIAQVQLGKTNIISKADFTHKLKNDFFHDDMLLLFTLLEYDLIMFKCEPLACFDDEFHYFEIDTSKFGSNPIF